MKHSRFSEILAWFFLIIKKMTRDIKKLFPQYNWTKFSNRNTGITCLIKASYLWRKCCSDKKKTYHFKTDVRSVFKK